MSDTPLAEYNVGLPHSKHVMPWMDKCKKLEQQLKEANDKLEVERMRLAGCSVAALGYFDGCDDEYKSASLDDVLSLYEQLKEANDELEHIYSLPELFIEWCMEGNDPRKYKYTMFQEPTKEDMEWAEKEVTKIKDRNKP